MKRSEEIYEGNECFFLFILGTGYHQSNKMPVREPPPPANSKQIGVTKSLLYNGSKFQGFQKSKGNSYTVEVVLQVSTLENTQSMIFYIRPMI